MASVKVVDVKVEVITSTGPEYRNISHYEEQPDHYLQPQPVLREDEVAFRTIGGQIVVTQMARSRIPDPEPLEWNHELQQLTPYGR